MQNENSTSKHTVRNYKCEGRCTQIPSSRPNRETWNRVKGRIGTRFLTNPLLKTSSNQKISSPSLSQVTTSCWNRKILDLSSRPKPIVRKKPRKAPMTRPGLKEARLAKPPQKVQTSDNWIIILQLKETDAKQGIIGNLNNELTKT